MTASDPTPEAGRSRLEARLEELGIAFAVHEHPAVFTVEEARVHTAHLPGGHCKNLFLKDKKGALWLATVQDDREVDLKALRRRVGAAQLSFGKPDLLRETLGVTPGSVTPLALINDEQRRVTPILDAALLKHGTINCHPLTNEATLALAAGDLLRFVEACGRAPVIVDLDAEPAA